MSKRRNAKSDGFGDALSLEELAGVTGGQGVPVLPSAGAKVVARVVPAAPGKTLAAKTLKNRELNILNSVVQDLSKLAKDEQALTAEVAQLLGKTGLKRT